MGGVQWGVGSIDPYGWPGDIPSKGFKAPKSRPPSTPRVGHWGLLGSLWDVLGVSRGSVPMCRGLLLNEIYYVCGRLPFAGIVS